MNNVNGTGALGVIFGATLGVALGCSPFMVLLMAPLVIYATACGGDETARECAFDRTFV